MSLSPTSKQFRFTASDKPYDIDEKRAVADNRHRQMFSPSMAHLKFVNVWIGATARRQLLREFWS